MATGIMQISPARFTGPLADTLPQYVPPLPVAGATGRWEASLIRQDIGTDVETWPGAGVGPTLTHDGSGFSGATAPELITGIGGTPSVHFDGVADVLGAPLALSSPNTVVVVASAVADAAGISAIVSGGVEPVNIRQVLGLSAQGRARVYDGAPLDLTAAGAIGTGMHVWMGVFNGASSVVRVDGTELVGNAGTNGGGDSVVLATYGALVTEMEVKTVIYYPFALDSADRIALTAALQDRHGI